MSVNNCWKNYLCYAQSRCPNRLPKLQFVNKKFVEWLTSFNDSNLSVCKLLTSTVYTVPVKGLDTPTHSIIFLYFIIFYIVEQQRIHQNYEITHMDSCSNQKSVIQIKIYLRFFRVASLCLDDSFAQSWHSLSQLHEIVTWNAFKLTGMPC